MFWFSIFTWLLIVHLKRCIICNRNDGKGWTGPPLRYNLHPIFDGSYIIEFCIKVVVLCCLFVLVCVSFLVTLIVFVMQCNSQSNLSGLDPQTNKQTLLIPFAKVTPHKCVVKGNKFWLKLDLGLQVVTLLQSLRIFYIINLLPFLVYIYLKVWLSKKNLQAVFACMLLNLNHLIKEHPTNVNVMYQIICSKLLSIERLFCFFFICLINF